MRRLPFNRANRKGFTLVEVLIVVVILGILAATVLPQFASTTEEAKESALKQNLQQIRSQIDLYRFQHNGQVPAKGLTSELAFKQCLICTTDVNGGTDGTLDPYTPGSKAFGPYLVGQFPANPINGLSTVDFTAGTNPGDGTTGWWYDSSKGQFRANLLSTVKSRDGVTVLNSL